MGSKNSKPVNYAELLEKTHKDIFNIRKQIFKESKRKPSALQSRHVISLLLIILIILINLIKLPVPYLLESSCFLISFVIIYNFIRFYFYKIKLEDLDKKLKRALDKRTKLLEDIKRTVPYNTAKIILEKYSSPPQKPQLPKASSIPNLITRNLTSCVGVIGELLLGERNSDRCALVCRSCRAICGMVPKEEHPYVTFTCMRCRVYNPAQKVKPLPPKLHGELLSVPFRNKLSM